MHGTLGHLSSACLWSVSQLPSEMPCLSAHGNHLGNLLKPDFWNSLQGLKGRGTGILDILQLPRLLLSHCFSTSLRISFCHCCHFFPDLITRTELRLCQVPCLSLASLGLKRPHLPVGES